MFFITLCMRFLLLSFVCFLLSAIAPSTASAQLSSGGIPPGFDIETGYRSINIIHLQAPHYATLLKEDDSLSALGVPERMGVSVAVFLSEQDGSPMELDAYRTMRQLLITVDDATGLGLYFSDFFMGPKDQLFIYAADKSHVIGAFTYLNNMQNRLFATEVVKGTSVIVEYIEDSSDGIDGTFMISEVLVAYKAMHFSQLRNAGSSGECEVNSICEEGNAWRDQINGIVRIMIKNGPSSYWCTGSIMNNTNLDFTPYILTADHCAANLGVYSTPEDVARWVFYFNHEARACDDDRPLITRSLIGAERIASSSANLNDGSDFYLVRLFENIPNTYNPYYLGWNTLNQLSNSGVSLHHPNGDVKKISTYTTPLQLTQWGQVPGTHFNVRWTETTNGHGVTEGGSSGSPLFDEQGHVIGQLTGGESSCTNVNGPDQYGRFFYSWDKNGTNPDMQLQPWLDPLNTGLQVQDGSYNTLIAIGQFVAEETVIPIGTTTSFIDLSRNEPDLWKWIFEGGSPETSLLQNPMQITYNQTGTFDVSLIVMNEYGVDTVRYADYIRVVPVVYPNPTKDKVNINFGTDSDEAQIIIHNSIGNKIADIHKPAGVPVLEYDFSSHSSGLFIISVKTEASNREDHYKLLFAR